MPSEDEEQNSDGLDDISSDSDELFQSESSEFDEDDLDDDNLDEDSLDDAKGVIHTCYR